MDANGLGAPPDAIKALYWFELEALKKGRALQNREKVLAQTNAGEQAIALTTARKCKELHYVGCRPPSVGSAAAAQIRQMPTMEQILQMPPEFLAQGLLTQQDNIDTTRLYVGSGATMQVELNGVST